MQNKSLNSLLFLPRKVTFEKQWFYLDNAIGHSYGTTFEVTGGGCLQPKKKKEEPTSGAPLWMCEMDAPAIPASTQKAEAGRSHVPGQAGQLNENNLRMVGRDLRIQLTGGILA